MSKTQHGHIFLQNACQKANLNCSPNLYSERFLHALIFIGRKSLRICQKLKNGHFLLQNGYQKGNFNFFPNIKAKTGWIGVHILQVEFKFYFFLDLFALTPLIITFYCVFRLQGFQIVLNLSSIQTFFINFWLKFLKLTVVKGTSSVLFQKVAFLTFW